jgi:hypothetical protein
LNNPASPLVRLSRYDPASNFKDDSDKPPNKLLDLYGEVAAGFTPSQR